MKAGEFFTYRFASTGRAIFYDGTAECAEAIQRAMPDLKVSYYGDKKIVKIARKTGGTLLPKDIRFAYPGAYIVKAKNDGRICTVMSVEQFEENLLKTN